MSKNKKNYLVIHLKKHVKSDCYIYFFHLNDLYRKIGIAIYRRDIKDPAYRRHGNSPIHEKLENLEQDVVF